MDLTKDGRTWRSGTATDVEWIDAPVWLRLVRTGPSVNAYRSAEGVHWSFVGYARVDLGAHPVVGLAVASHVPDRLSTAVLDQVRVAPVRGR